MDPESGPERTVAEPRQRWRVTFGRGTEAAATTHRELAETWSAALAASLPLPRSESSRQRPPLTFAAPLPVGVVAERELADLLLAERLPAWRVRESVCESAPVGVIVSAVHDVWLGAPALAASVLAADYRITLALTSCEPAIIHDAAARLLSAATLERRRPKGTESVAYDLRPLLAAIDVRDGPPTVLLVRTRFHQERGAGRPEEVLAALGDALGTSLEATEIVRERILLADAPDGLNSPPVTFDARLT